MLCGSRSRLCVRRLNVERLQHAGGETARDKGCQCHLPITAQRCPPGKCRQRAKAKTRRCKGEARLLSNHSLESRHSLDPRLHSRKPCHHQQNPSSGWTTKVSSSSLIASSCAPRATK